MTESSYDDAEKILLGAVLVNNSCLPDSLNPDDLGDSRHRNIFAAMKNLSSSGSAIDLVTLRHELTRTSGIERAGGVSYIAGLVEGVPKIENVKPWLAIIMEGAARRLLQDAAEKINRLVAENASPAAIVQVMDHCASMARDKTHSLDGPTKIGSHVKSLLVKIEDEADGKDTGAVMTGFKSLDVMTGGFKPGDLVIVAGYTGTGKSSFASTVAINCKRPVLLFSREMTEESIAERVLFGQSGVNRIKVKSGLEEEEWTRLGAAYGKVLELPIWLDDKASTVAAIRSRSLKLKEKEGIRLVCIDYLQLLSGDGGENRHQEISKISRSLKLLAGELGIPIMALSQLSRAAKDRKDKRPMLSDLKESGSIENDANTVLLLYREDGRVDQSRTEIIVAKQRSGPTGMILLDFDKTTTTFMDIKETE